MTTYVITAPHFCAAVIVNADACLQAAPILKWTIGKTFTEVRDYCRNRGWSIEPVVEQYKPSWIEVAGLAYELHWKGDVITRVTLHEDGEMKDLRFDEIPEQLRQLL